MHVARALINLLVLWVQFVLKRSDAYFLSEGLKSREKLKWK